MTAKRRLFDMTRVRVSIAAALTLGVLTAGAGLGLVLATAGPAAAQATAAAVDGYICADKDVCRNEKTRLPLRVLPRVQSNIYERMDKGSKVVQSDVAAFVPLFVFKREKVSYADPLRPEGWFQVGPTRDRPVGFMHAADALEWRTAIVLSYTHRGVGDSERSPVIMFKDKKPLEDFVLADGLRERAAQYYTRLKSGDVPDGIITREPDTFVDIRKKFYLLPVIESRSLDDQGLDDVHILQLAAAVPDKRAVKPEELCTTERRDFAKCAEETGTVRDDELRVNVVYVMDFTGSMGRAMEAVTRGMSNSARVFAQASKEANRVRFGLVAYRDHMDADPKNEFVTRNFTNSFLGSEFVDIMRRHAKPLAGGDLEEEVIAGLIDGLNNSKWEDGAVKLIFLIGDASGHDPSHRFSTTGKDARFVRNEANIHGVQIAAIYIKNPDQSTDWAKGMQQFRELAENPGSEPAFRAAENDDANAIENAISEATNMMVERLRRLKPERSPSSAATTAARRAPRDTTLPRAFEVGLVEFIGKATEPPKDITAWVVDKDLTNLGRKSFDVHVLVTRNDLEQLTRGLQSVIDAYELHESTGEGFFKSLQALTTVAALDEPVSRAMAIGRTNVLPRWIEALPYKSEITAMKFDDFEQMTPDKRTQLNAKLRSLVKLYKSILERPQNWQKLNDQMPPEDHVYPLALENMP